jgi:hypothetical protein
MAQPNNKPKPWMIAAWPGMGSVAVVAAGYLVRKLGTQPIGELPGKDHFDVDQVNVQNGLIAPPRLPRGLLFRWTNPAAGRDLIVFLGEAQPSSGTYAYAHELVSRAREMGVERIVTFASMATALDPTQDPHVFGVATGETTLADLKRAEVEPMEDGQIGGLNGVVLGAGAEQGVPGLCLLGEIPFFAAGVPNPKAAKAILSVFSIIAGVDVSLDELAKHGQAMEKVLLELMRRLQQQAQNGEASEEGDEEGRPVPEAADEKSAPEKPAPEKPAKQLDYATRQRIESLFHDAARDRNQAMRLKEELDKLGVFEMYEDRFLDLFKRAG